MPEIDSASCGRHEIEKAHKSFMRLLEILRPDHVMVMEAYFDESSTHDNSPVMCVAGYLLTADNAAHLSREWGRTLTEFGMDHFHAAEFPHAASKLGFNQQKRNDLMQKLVGIIRRRVEIGIAVSVSETDFGQVEPPKWTKGDPYLFAVLFALSGVVAWAEKISYTGEISYIFEAGHAMEAQAHRAIGMMKDTTSRYLRYRSHAFVKKRDALPLQAADLLAYEWCRELRRINTPNPRNRPMRKSLESLLKRTHIAQHYGARDIHLAFTKGYEALAKKIRFEVV
jgi:hypothetical protein